MGFTCRWFLPLQSRKNLPWIQHAPRSVCPGQSNQPKEIRWLLLHGLLGSWSSGPQATNRCHRKGKPGLPFGWLTGSRVQDPQPVARSLFEKGMGEKALEGKRGALRFGIRFACTGYPVQNLLQHRPCISREPLWMHTKEIPDNPHGWGVPQKNSSSLRSPL